MKDQPELYLPILYGAGGIVGLVSCFLGYKLFKIVLISLMALVGAILLSGVGYMYGEPSYLWSVAGLVVGAILGGVLALSFYALAVATLAALFVATSALPWIQDLEVWLQWTILGIACLVAAFIATALSRIMIQVGTAMLGAILLMHSVLYFTTGQTIHQVEPGSRDFTLYLNLDGLMAVIAIGVGLLGFFFQRHLAKD